MPLTTNRRRIGGAAISMDQSPLSTASAKVRRHLLPFLIICYFAAYLDRVNVGFAALTMNKDLGLGPEAYGFTAGIFFLGYCLFEVPSNILLEKFGARTWIARIMITWGLVSASMAFVTDVWSYSVIRFFLGVAEAGFFPGIIFYLTRWVTSRERAAMICLFMTAIPISNLIGAPVSGAILDSFNGVLGLKGWQWLFVLEALPSIILGSIAFFVLRDSPTDAPWLEPAERAALTVAIAAEDRNRESLRKYTLRDALTDPRVLGLSLVYFGIATGMYGLTFWLPQIVKAFGFDNTTTGFITAIPYLFATAAMALWGRHSDRTGERVWHIALPCLVGGAAMIAGTQINDHGFALAALTIAAMGIFTALPTFWTLPSAMLTGTAAAAGIALINSVGNIGGFIGPYLMGWLMGQGYSSEIAVASLAAFAIISGLLVLTLGHDRRLETAAA